MYVAYRDAIEWIADSLETGTTESTACKKLAAYLFGKNLAQVNESVRKHKAKTPRQCFHCLGKGGYYSGKHDGWVNCPECFDTDKRVRP